MWRFLVPIVLPALCACAPALATVTSGLRHDVAQPFRAASRPTDGPRAGLKACATYDFAARLQESSTQQIVLAPKQSARIDGTSLSITLDEVADDSRCPKDVTCVWAGDVAVHIRVDDGKAPAHTATLHLNVGEKETVHADRRIALIAVSPYPESTGKIDPASYRATFRVAR